MLNQYLANIYIINVLILFVPLFLQVYTEYQDWILNSPKVKQLGAWGPWENCDKGNLVTGVLLKKQTPKDTDEFGISGIQLYCGDNGEINANSKVIQSSVAREGKWDENAFSCDGYVEGFQLKIDTIGPGDDYAGITNIRIFCTGGINFFSPETQSVTGEWTQSKKCLKGQAVCGIRTMIKNLKERKDLVGINSLKMMCCKIPNHVFTCFPRDRWEIVFEVDNSLGYEPITYTYTKQVGMAKKTTENHGEDGSAKGGLQQQYNQQQTNNRMQNRRTRMELQALATINKRSFNQKYKGRGINIEKFVRQDMSTDAPMSSTISTTTPMATTSCSEKKDDNQEREKIIYFYRQKLEASKKTGFNWNRASDETFAPMRSTNLDVIVSPGHYIALYQVVGICGDYFVRPEKFYQNGSFNDPASNRVERGRSEWKNLSKISKVLNSISAIYKGILKVCTGLASILGYNKNKE